MPTSFAAATAINLQFLQLFQQFSERDMDDGVAYMVMGETGEGGQGTQVVAVDNGDGTQQLVSFSP